MPTELHEELLHAIMKQICIYRLGWEQDVRRKFGDAPCKMAWSIDCQTATNTWLTWWLVKSWLESLVYDKAPCRPSNVQEFGKLYGQPSQYMQQRTQKDLLRLVVVFLWERISAFKMSCLEKVTELVIKSEKSDCRYLCVCRREFHREGCKEWFHEFNSGMLI